MKNTQHSCCRSAISNCVVINVMQAIIINMTGSFQLIKKKKLKSNWNYIGWAKKGDLTKNRLVSNYFKNVLSLKLNCWKVFHKFSKAFQWSFLIWKWSFFIVIDFSWRQCFRRLKKTESFMRKTNCCKSFWQIFFNFRNFR